MIEGALNKYLYNDKTCLVSVADSLLTPTRDMLGYKTIQVYDAAKGVVVKEEDVKSQDLCYRILLIPVALVLLPITFIVCVLKLLCTEAQRVHNLYLGKFSKIIDQNAYSNLIFSPREALPPKEEVLQPKLTSTALTQEQVDELFGSQLHSLSSQQLQILSEVLEQFSAAFEACLNNKEVPKGLFNFTRKAPHVIKLRMEVGVSYIGKSIKININGVQFPLTVGNLATIVNRHLLKAHKEVVLGTKPALSAGFVTDWAAFIYLRGFETDPFDPQHILPIDGAGIITIDIGGGEYAIRDQDGYRELL